MTRPATTPAASTRIRSARLDFLTTEAAGGIVLVVAAIGAVAWANVAPESLDHVLAVDAGPLDVHAWINDGLMALFFLVVGLEISRELTVGELRRWRTAALPVIAALGGMIVPALLFAAVNFGHEGTRGWGVPMATDIAFAVGVLALLGRRVPAQVKLFLLALAIVDDLGAIVVIALAYSRGIHVWWLLAAIAAVAGVWLARGHPAALLALGAAAWWCTHEAGVHATIAGVALGFAVPAARGEPYERRLHPITTFLVVPLFALANSGVRLSTDALSGPGTRVAVGVVVGLVIGKPLGIAAATWVALRLRIAVLPEGSRVGQIVAAGAVAGIGFTVSLFMTELAFHRQVVLLESAKVAVLAASLIAAAVGAVAFLVLGRAEAPNG